MVNKEDFSGVCLCLGHLEKMASCLWIPVSSSLGWGRIIPTSHSVELRSLSQTELLLFLSRATCGTFEGMI